MNKAILIALSLVIGLNADVSVCTDKLEDTTHYIACITKEADKTQAIEDIDFAAGYLVTKDRFDEAIKLYEKSASQGDAKAMYYLGGIYEEQKKEYAKAVEWYKKAADKNYKDAIYRAGVLLEKELNKEAEAIAYYEAWIKKGDVEAYNYLGNLYLDKEEFQKAKEQYLKGAEKGSIESFYLLGSLHQTYFNATEDAIGYYKKAAEKGEYKSIYNLAVMYDNVAEYNKAEPWYKKAMALGNKDAYYGYGHLLRKKGDLKGALDTFEKLALLDDNRGYMAMARVYMNEYKDYDSAEKYLLKLVAKGNGDAASAIGSIYGGQRHSIDKEIEWYKKAYALGSCTGTKNLALTFRNDLKDEEKYNEWLDKADAMDCGFAGTRHGDDFYLKKDYKNAIVWYKRGAALGNKDATYNLGYVYEIDLKDKEKAIYWYKKAASLGDTGAKKELKRLGVR